MLHWLPPGGTHLVLALSVHIHRGQELRTEVSQCVGRYQPTLRFNTKLNLELEKKQLHVGLTWLLILS